ILQDGEVCAMSLWKKIEKALQYAEHAEFLAKLVAPMLLSLFGGRVLSIFVARYANLSTDWKTAVWLLGSGLLFYLYVWVRPKLSRRLPETPLIIHRAVYGAGSQAYLS